MDTSQLRASQREIVSTIGGSGIAMVRMPTLLRLVVAFVTLVAGLGVVSIRQAEAAEQVPFRAISTTTSVGSPCGVLTVCVSVEGSGQATHLGRFELTKSVVLLITFEPCPGGTVRVYTAEAALMAANGDTITMSGSGTVCAGPSGILASGSYRVTGGTGRFSGASGTIAESIVLVPPGPESVTLLGTISSPGS